MNICQIVGNLTRDPEMSQNGKCDFTVAVNRPFLNKNGQRDADYIRVICFEKRAETCMKYLSKGSKVAVVGSIRTGSYEAQDGTKRYTFDIAAENIEFLTPKNAQSAPEPVRNNTHTDIGAMSEITDDELPF